VEYNEVMEEITRVFEVIGVAIIAIGGVVTFLKAILGKLDRHEFLNHAKHSFGAPLILGLEVLVAADIIETVTVDLSLESVLTLGILVLVRVVLSWSLEIEIDGMAPWQRAKAERAEKMISEN
jgi:uncharacterized membrane protein